MITEPSGFAAVALARAEIMPMKKIETQIASRKELLKQDRSTERTSPPRGPLPIYLHPFASSRADIPLSMEERAQSDEFRRLLDRRLRSGNDMSFRVDFKVDSVAHSQDECAWILEAPLNVRDHEFCRNVPWAPVQAGLD